MPDVVADEIPVFGDEYWKSRAEDLIDGMDVQFYYGVVPGDENYPAYLSEGDLAEHYLDLGEDVGYQRLVRNLKIQETMQTLHWNDAPGDRDEATNLWLHRDEDLPDWFWRYHGVYA